MIDPIRQCRTMGPALVASGQTRGTTVLGVGSGQRWRSARARRERRRECFGKAQTLKGAISSKAQRRSPCAVTFPLPALP